MVASRYLTARQKSTLLARAPLILFWAEQAIFAQEALDKFGQNASNYEIAGIALSCVVGMTRPVGCELLFRAKWYARYLDHLMHQLDVPTGRVEEFRHPKLMQDDVDTLDITTGRCRLYIIIHWNTTALLILRSLAAEAAFFLTSIGFKARHLFSNYFWSDARIARLVIPCIMHAPD